MNDFTKEELKFLHSAIYERPFSITPKMDEMRSKIKSMIEGYCEHECDHEFRLSKSFYGVDESLYRCTKCLKKYDEVVNDNQ